VARLIYSARALHDLDRLTDFLMESDPHAARDTAALVVQAVAVLANHPMIGHPADSGLRELVISRGHSGYVALYRVDLARDVVRILAIRHQREAGYFAGTAT
jgi:plasmid stabilization system protein ParE